MNAGASAGVNAALDKTPIVIPGRALRQQREGKGMTMSARYHFAPRFGARSPNHQTIAVTAAKTRLSAT